MYICVLMYFTCGAPNYRKTPNPGNPISQAFRTKDLTPVL